MGNVSDAAKRRDASVPCECERTIYRTGDIKHLGSLMSQIVLRTLNASKQQIAFTYFFLSFLPVCQSHSRVGALLALYVLTRLVFGVAEGGPAPSFLVQSR